MELFTKFRLILMLAVRNVWLHRTKSLIIATLLGIGSTIMTMGLSLLEDIDETMEDSIINSVAGHFQIYSNAAKDDLALFGGAFMGREDIGTVDDISKVYQALAELPEVQSVVPMGIDFGLLGRGNELDDAFDSLRKALQSNDSASVDLAIENARRQINLLKAEVEERGKVTSDKETINDYLSAIESASQDEFWKQLANRQEETLTFLETKIAPASGEKSPVYLRSIGTDFGKFKDAFSKFRIVSGQMVPDGERGMLIAYKTREDFLKNVVARLFDKLNKMLVIQKRSLRSDPEAERTAADLARQYLQIQLHIEAGELPQLRQALAAVGIPLTADSNEALTAAIQDFLKVTDDTFVQRHQVFYNEIAPLIKLYEISPGDTIVVRSYTKSGYIRNVPLKVYGIFSFTGIENSDLAGSFNLMDLISFRELYGKMSAESLQELEDLRKTSGIRQVDRASAEDDLFGDSSVIETQASQEDPAQQATAAESIKIRPQISSTFAPEEINSGLALNLAVKVQRQGNLNQEQAVLEKKLAEHGLDLKVVNWKTASGFVGQFVTIIRVVLVTSVTIILLIALVIINNSLVIAVYNRIREIGTMRAMGAQKSFVMALFLAETGVMGLVGAAIGIGLSSGLLYWMRSVGIPAGHEVIEFLFSGPRLYPNWHVDLLVGTPCAILVLAVIASVYTARYAGAVAPSEAMQDKE